MLLQNTINELNSGIINIENNKIKLTGFLSEERLNDYLDGDDCRCLIGVFRPKALLISVIPKYFIGFL